MHERIGSRSRSLVFQQPCNRTTLIQKRVRDTLNIMRKSRLKPQVLQSRLLFCRSTSNPPCCVTVALGCCLVQRLLLSLHCCTCNGCCPLQWLLPLRELMLPFLRHYFFFTGVTVENQCFFWQFGRGNYIYCHCHCMHLDATAAQAMLMRVCKKKSISLL